MTRNETGVILKASKGIGASAFICGQISLGQQALAIPFDKDHKCVGRASFVFRSIEGMLNHRAASPEAVKQKAARPFTVRAAPLCPPALRENKQGNLIMNTAKVEASDDLESLAAIAPRVQNYTNPNEYYDDLTRWFIDVGMLVKGIQSSPKASAHRCPRAKRPDAQIARAAYIVGCLILDGAMKLNLDDSTSREEFNDAVKTIGDALRMTEPDEIGGWPHLPFE